MEGTCVPNFEWLTKAQLYSSLIIMIQCHAIILEFKLALFLYRPLCYREGLGTKLSRSTGLPSETLVPFMLQCNKRKLRD